MPHSRHVVPLSRERLARLAIAALSDDTEADPDAVDIRRKPLSAAQQACADAADAGLPLAAVAHAMTRTILTGAILQGADQVLLASYALDDLAQQNDAVIDWHDADGFAEIAARYAAAFDADPELEAWLASAVLPNTDYGSWLNGTLLPTGGGQPPPLHAFVLGPMTGLAPARQLWAQRVVNIVADELRRLGMTVHAPAGGPPPDLPDQHVTAGDLDHLARADLLVAVVWPPALGVGMLLAHSDRTRQPVLILGKPDSDVTPLTASLADRCEMRPMTGEKAVALEVRRYVNERRSQIEAASADRRARTAALAAQQAAAAVAVRAALAAGGRPDGPLPRVRALQITSSPENFAAASVWELALLTEWLGLPPVVLGLGPVGAAPSPPLPAPDTPMSDPTPLALTLFDAGVRDAAPRRAAARPRDWQTRAWLSPVESAAGRRASRAMGLSIHEEEAMFEEAAGRRCDESLLASGMRNRLPLDEAPDWEHFWAYYRDRR